jgi:hypothetical protein
MTMTPLDALGRRESMSSALADPALGAVVLAQDDRPKTTRSIADRIAAFFFILFPPCSSS